MLARRRAWIPLGLRTPSDESGSLLPALFDRPLNELLSGVFVDRRTLVVVDVEWREPPASKSRLLRDVVETDVGGSPLPPTTLTRLRAVLRPALARIASTREGFVVADDGVSSSAITGKPSESSPAKGSCAPSFREATRKSNSSFSNVAEPSLPTVVTVCSSALPLSPRLRELNRLALALVPTIDSLRLDTLLFKYILDVVPAASLERMVCSYLLRTESKCGLRGMSFVPFCV
jgi:hypothetical protein